MIRGKVGGYMNNETQEVKQTPKKSVEELLLDLYWATYQDGHSARLLLVEDKTSPGWNGPVVRIAEPNVDDMFDFDPCHEGPVYEGWVKKLPEGQWNAMSPDERQAAFVVGSREASLEHIARTRATLIGKIKVLMARGYVPVGVVSPDSKYNMDSLAGYLPDGEARQILEAFHSGFTLNHPDHFIHRDLDLGTVNRAKRDLDIA